MFCKACEWTQRINVMILMLLMLLSILIGGLSASAAPYPTLALRVAPLVETDPVPSGNDTADDIAIWLHPTDQAKSRIIGVDKAFGDGGGGLIVYDLAGNQLQYLKIGSLNNVDVRYNFLLSGQPADLIVASNQTHDRLSIFRINREGIVENVAVDELGIPIQGMRVYGSCMYRSPFTGKYYAFVSQNPYNTTPTGKIQQFELFDAGSGKVGTTLVRTFDVGSEAEACVADDVTGDLYVAETRVGIWRYGAEPGAGTNRVQVDSISSVHFSGEKELEGLTLYYAGSNRGYLIVAGQFTSAYFIYRRDKNQLGGHDYVTSFQIGAGNGIDGVTGTDGIDVTNVDLGDRFPKGAFIAHDQVNTEGTTTANSNYKVVPWESIAESAPSPLTIDTSYNPRGGQTPAPAPSPAPSPISRTFTATADARVEEATPDTNFGDDPELRVRGGSPDPHIRSYLRFNVSGTQGVQRAKLRLYATSNTTDGPAIYATSNNWSESTITWRQAPGITGGVLDDKGVITSGTWVEYDVTSIVKGDGTYNFVLVSNTTDSLRAMSKEDTNPPQLVLTVRGKQVFLPLVLKAN